MQFPGEYENPNSKKGKSGRHGRDWRKGSEENRKNDWVRRLELLEIKLPESRWSSTPIFPCHGIYRRGFDQFSVEGLIAPTLNFNRSSG